MNNAENRIALFGVPGAGKTTICNKIHSNKKAKEIFLVDEGDIQKIIGKYIRNNITSDSLEIELTKVMERFVVFCFVDTKLSTCYERNQKRKSPWGGRVKKVRNFKESVWNFPAKL